MNDFNEGWLITTPEQPTPTFFHLSRRESGKSVVVRCARYFMNFILMRWWEQLLDSWKKCARFSTLCEEQLFDIVTNGHSILKELPNLCTELYASSIWGITFLLLCNMYPETILLLAFRIACSGSLLVTAVCMQTSMVILEVITCGVCNGAVLSLHTVSMYYSENNVGCCQLDIKMRGWVTSLQSLLCLEVSCH